MDALFLHGVPAPLYLYLAVFAGFSFLSLVVLWPIFGRDFPPGVDSPTFLHLAWVTQLAVSGQLADPLTDPYWYGGFPYLAAYPPLGYGLVGLLGAIPGFSFVVVYQILLVIALAGVGAATYGLARELGLQWWGAALAAVLTSISYPILGAVFLWGWFPSVLALPLGLLAVTLLERAANTGRWSLAAWGGVSLGFCTLVHHMTGAAFALALIGWLVLQLALGRYTWRRTTIHFTLFATVATLVVLPWGVPFLIHILDVDFRREIPGNWMPALSVYGDNILNRDLIGALVYPSYLASIPLFVLAIAATVYSLISRHRVAGVTVMLLVLTWFSIGAKANPLVNHYPFSGLDVARFPLYMVPLMALLAGWLLDAAVRAAEPIRARLAADLRPRLWPAAIGLLLAGILVLPVMDMVKARGVMDSYRVDPPMAQALEFLSGLPSNGAEGPPAQLFCVGCWNWDAFLIPYESNVSIVDGWADEGAPNVDQVRPLRRTTWVFDNAFVVEGEEVHRRLAELGATHVLLAPYYSLEDTEGFRREFRAYPQLFVLRQRWGPLELYEVLPALKVKGPGGLR